MTQDQLINFIGWALIYAVSLTVPICVGLLFLNKAWVVLASPAIFLTTFFLALTHHPFPNPATFDCSDGGEQPLFTPFQFVRAMIGLWRNNASPEAWIFDLSVASAAMNLAICAAIGAALASFVRRAGWMLVFAIGLSGLVEISQLTGVFGLYDCSYRQFDVDDLILNVAGVVLGFVLGRRLMHAKL